MKCSDERSHAIRLTVYSAEDAVRIDAKGSDSGQEFNGLLMPMRAKAWEAWSPEKPGDEPQAEVELRDTSSDIPSDTLPTGPVAPELEPESDMERDRR
jgi:hypothetical protein